MKTWRLFVESGDEGRGQGHVCLPTRTNDNIIDQEGWGGGGQIQV